jgi:hypothetical protein
MLVMLLHEFLIFILFLDSFHFGPLLSLCCTKGWGFLAPNRARIGIGMTDRLLIGGSGG